MKPLWTPTESEIRSSALDRFRRSCDQPDYAALHRWSIDHRDEFWARLWDFAGIVGERGSTVAEDLDAMPGTRWFPEARLNFAENLLTRREPGTVLVERDEAGGRRDLSGSELAERVASVAAHFADFGIGRGDRVAAVVPNRIEAVVAMLATAQLGAVFSSCSPDFGVDAIVDRFGQIGPKLLIGCDGYAYNGRWFDCAARLADAASRLPSVIRVVTICASAASLAPGLIDFASLERHPAPRRHFEHVAFDAPLFILFSSGTTGKPKCIVHGVGGTLLKHASEHLLHCDIRPGERLLFFTTCGWMMWNWLVSALARSATVCLYDGSPMHPDPGVLLRYVDEEVMQHLGISPGYLSGVAHASYQPRAHHALTSLRSILSTGSPLPAERFEWAYRNIAGVRVSSISGGTDIMGCFALGNPTLPVYAGEIQSPGLGMAVAFFDDDGNALPHGRGELVCTRSFPSLPLGFWNDADGSRYHAAYFERFPGVWHHGDFGEFTEHGGVLIHGRSDAVLNRSGVRIGTAELYRPLEAFAEIIDAIAVAYRGEENLEIVLFVRLAPGAELDSALTGRIEQAIRAATSPRHVPDRIIAVDDVPRTRSGKLVELAVADVIHGRTVKNLGALGNPDALDAIRRAFEAAR